MPVFSFSPLSNSQLYNPIPYIVKSSLSLICRHIQCFLQRKPSPTIRGSWRTVATCPFWDNQIQHILPTLFCLIPHFPVFRDCINQLYQYYTVFMKVSVRLNCNIKLQIGKYVEIYRKPKKADTLFIGRADSLETWFHDSIYICKKYPSSSGRGDMSLCCYE